MTILPSKVKDVHEWNCSSLTQEELAELAEEAGSLEALDLIVNVTEYLQVLSLGSSEVVKR